MFKQYLNPCRTFVLSFAFLALLPLAAEAETPIRVCFEEWVPFMVRDDAETKEGPADAVSGPSVETIRAAARAIDRDVVFATAPFARCVRDVSLGRFDMVLTIGKGVGGLETSEIPLAFWSIGAVVRKDDEIARFRDMSQFDGRRVLLTHPFEYPDAIMNSREDWNSLEWIKLNSGIGAEEYSRPLRMIEGERADVFFDDSFWAQQVIDMSDAEVRLLYPPVHTEPTYIGYAPEQRDLQVRMDSVLADMVESGEIDSIYEASMDVSWQSLEKLTR